jgi:hypothetical protein
MQIYFNVKRNGRWVVCCFTVIDFVESSKEKETSKGHTGLYGIELLLG